MTVPSLDYLDRVRKPRATPTEEPTVRAVSYKPTEAMREEARRGLEWRRKHGRGGTAIGVARARDISNGRSLPLDTVKRMVSYFARHEIDKQGQGWSPGEDGYPSAGRIAWALWGGDAGRSWANKIVDGAEERYNPDQPRDENGRWSSGGGGFDVSSTEFDTVSGSMVREARDSKDPLMGGAENEDELMKKRTSVAVESRLSGVSTDDLIASSEDGKVLAKMKRVHVDGEPWQKVYPTAKRLADPPIEEWELKIGLDRYGVVTGYLEHPEKGMIALDQRGDDVETPLTLGDAERAIRVAVVSEHVSRWASSSNDSDPRSLLMQEAAEQEFGVESAAGWTGATKSTITKMDKLRPTLVPVQKQIARAMYDETQAVFAKAGIKEVSVTRGMVFDKSSQLDDVMEAGGAVQMRPLSSWSTDSGTAAYFAGGDEDASALFSTKVPVSRVFSMPGTGFGCLGESEVVLLGGEMQTDVRVGADIAELFEDRAYNPNQPRDENGRWSSAGGGFAPDDPVMVEVLSTMADDARASGDLFIPSDAPNDQALKARAASAIEARLGDVSTDELIATMGGSKHLDDVKRVFIDGEPWEEVYPDQARVIENPDQYQLRLGVDDSGIVTPYLYRSSTATIHPLGGSYPSVDDVDYHDAERAIRTSIVSRHIQQWAQTSNDHNARSLLAQEAAQREFGIDDAADWDIEPAQLRAEMDSLRPTLLPVQQKIARAMYEETQAVLAKAGVTELSVVRGMGLESTDQLAQFLDKANPISMRPMSSWSTETQTAAMFAGGGETAILLSTKVPASRILSMPGTGFGCLNEGEVVLLGGTMEADIVYGDEIWDLAG